jgi:hypothetical protein
VNLDDVDFQTPGRPPAIFFFINPGQYVYRRELAWIGKKIPRTDVRWIAQILSKLSPNQIRDAFRAAGYTPEEVERFAGVLERRITVLRDI